MKKFLLVTGVIVFCLFVVIMLMPLDEEGELYEEDTGYEDSEVEGADVEYEPNKPEGQSTGTSWVLYWYLCGSDLESEYGSASSDLEEMMEVSLPEGVKVVIQTGGAYQWDNDFVDPNYTERYVYDSEGLQLVEQLPVANMGDPATLADFLSFAHTNYPGDYTMLNFWNHGGGSVTGAAFDELFNNDSLTLPEMKSAIDNVYGAQAGEYYPLDIVGFDTCLMATLSTAHTFSNHANYLVASQELEPGNGWYYSGIMQALANNPSINPLDLSVAICDTYVEGCEWAGTEDDITLSVTDLSKLGGVISAYDNFGVQALNYAINDPNFFTRFDQNAYNTENYGGNTREQGYTNMIDIGGLAENTSDVLPEVSSALISAIDEAVVYKIDSVYRPDGMGISGYYPYDYDLYALEQFAAINPVESLDYLYRYSLTGSLDETGMQYVSNELSYTEPLPAPTTIETVGSSWEDAPIPIDENGNAVLTLGPEAYNALSSIAFELYYTHDETDELLMLGSDNDIDADWENGIFKDNFRGVWGSIDGAICYMDIVYEADEFNEYSVPVLINGEEYNLIVVYDYEYEMYFIIGARHALSEQGAGDKNIYELQVGDVVETIHYSSDIYSDDDEFTSFIGDSIVVTEETSFTEEALPDGYYLWIFRMQDCQGNYIYSDVVAFETYEVEIYYHE